MTQSSKMPLAGALPLLERAITNGKGLDPTDMSTRAELANWVDKILLLIHDTDGINPMFIAGFEKSMKGVFLGDFDDATKRRAMKRAISLLEDQLEILKAKTPTAMSTSRRPLGSKIFIGHGRDPAWMELRHYLMTRCHLDTDDFDGVSAAGKTVTGRLTEMLDAAAFAIIIMSAEDEVGDGSTRARQNVVHEVGLFQGRLGFDRTIVLMQEGCAPFSNLAGLVYISFPKGGIGAAFEKIRWALESHGLVKGLVP